MPSSLQHRERMLAHLESQQAIATAYGLLWLVSIDNRRLDSRRVSEARKLLLTLLTKDGQREGIARAQRFELDDSLMPVYAAREAE